MATTISILLSVLFLLILGITMINRSLRRSKDRKLRKWCVEQAVRTDSGDKIDVDTGRRYLTPKGAVLLADSYYEFVTAPKRSRNEAPP